MTTFAKSGFSGKNYLQFRPQYTPTTIINVLNAYHGRRLRNAALDIGCGPGQMAKLLAQSYKHVSAVDPSEAMIKAAPTDIPNIKFHLGSAEDLSWIDSESMDLVTAAQCAHWFDQTKVRCYPS